MFLQSCYLPNRIYNTDETIFLYRIDYKHISLCKNEYGISLFSGTNEIAAVV